MNKRNIKLIIDAAFLSAVTFFVLFVAFYYFLPRLIAITLAVTFTLILTLLGVTLNVRKYKTKKETAKKNESINELVNRLAFYNRAEVLSLFYKAFKDDGEVVQKKNGFLYLPVKKQGVFFELGFDGLSKSAVVKAVNKLSPTDCAIIYSSFCQEDIKAFAKRFDGRVKVLGGNDVYERLKNPCDLLKSTPRICKETQLKKTTVADFLDRKKAKRFLALGLLFLLFSFFVPIKIYYIVCGCVLSVFSLFVLIFVKPKIT